MRKKRLFNLILVMALGLSACGTKSDMKETTGNKTDKHAVFQEERDIFDIGEGDISQIAVVGDTIYIEQYLYQDTGMQNVEMEDGSVENMETENEVPSESTETENVTMEEDILIEDSENTNEIMEEAYPANTMITIRTITGFSADGTLKSKFQTEMDPSAGAGSFTVDDAGNIYTIRYQYASYEEQDMKDKVFLSAYTADGELTWELYLNENMAEGEYFYISSLHCNDKNQIIVDSSRGIEIYDIQGSPVKLIEKQNQNEFKLVQIREEAFALVSSDDSSASVQTVDLQSGALGEKITLPFNYYRYQISDGKAYDMYLIDEYGIYGYNLGDGEVTKVMDYISSDFAQGSLYQAKFIDENTFFANYYEEGPVLSKFTKVAAENVVDKTEIVVGCYYLNHNVKQKLIEFNKSNQQYRLNIKDYSMYDTMDEYNQGLIRLNTDIVSGEVPDILILNSQMPFESFAAKGVFADLNEFLEKDDQLKKEDLLASSLAALSSDDGLYRIAPTFSITGFVGKTADVGSEPGWTMSEAMELLSTKPEGTQLLSEVTASNFLYYTIWICGEQYVDWDKGKCYFDSEGFIKTLEFAKTLPTEIDYSTITDDEAYWQEMETQYRNGKTILSMQYLSGFRDYNYAKQAVFGEDITLVGFPVNEGMGAGLTFDNPMAISALSKHQDVAWEFVKTFFTKEYQESLEYNFPTRVDALKKLEEKAWEKPYYLDENGNKQEYEESFYVGGMEIPVEPMKPEETAKVMEYINQLDTLCIYDETLYNIVMEEAAGYFEGQKTAEEVAKVIQSRAKIYVSENS